MSALVRFRTGYPRRLRLAVGAAIAVFAVDHASKLAASVVEPGTYVHNTSRDVGLVWLLAVIPFVACLLPFQPFSLATGFYVGGATSNVFDVYVWPGGVPDFIESGWPAGVWNVADLFIWCGIALFFAALPAWAIRGIWRRARGTVEEPDVPRDAAPASLVTRGPL